MRGVEIMILRIGLPLACTGLLDNDKGVFKTYLTKFFQSTVAVMVQISLCKLGVGMMMNVGINLNVFWGIACLVLAIKTPRFLSEFMVPTGGGGRYGQQYLPFCPAGRHGKKPDEVRRWRHDYA